MYMNNTKCHSIILPISKMKNCKSRYRATEIAKSLDTMIVHSKKLKKPIINKRKNKAPVVKIDNGDFPINRVETRDGVRARQHEYASAGDLKCDFNDYNSRS